MLMDVLVVDDEPYMQRALSFVLRKEGFDVEVASNGEEGLKKARDLRPKLVFLDLMMPRMNGFDACRNIKSDASLKDTHVIILTAKGQELDRERGMKEGADGYMTKPFSPKEVVKVVRDIIGGR